MNNTVETRSEASWPPVTGHSIVAGDRWLDTANHSFNAVNPSTGDTLAPRFFCANEPLIDAAADRASVAFDSYGHLNGPARAALLDEAASQLGAVKAALIDRAHRETGLACARLDMEFARTTRTFRLFASAIRDAAWSEPIIDPPASDAPPGSIAANDIRRMRLPLGPVAVFGASNFPLAYGVAGGDTASAWAAGCPVIVKGHPSHPGTGEIAAHALTRAAQACHLDAGVFSYLQAGGDDEMNVGARLVSHPHIHAVGFTGSFKGGMALARLAAERPVPIPVFAEMGSANPVFILPAIARDQPDDVAARLAASILDASGQQCTCPGILFVLKAASSTALVRALGAALDAARANVMLSHRVRRGYLARVSECLRIGNLSCTPALASAASSPLSNTGPVTAPAGLLESDFESFRSNETFRHEIFGPAALVVWCTTIQELVDASRVINGSLAASIFAADQDLEVATPLLQSLSRRVGRVAFNSVTTGVRVTQAMVHGGPFPATNRPDTTAVGPSAIHRWTRPICLQNMPIAMLPDSLRTSTA